MDYKYLVALPLTPQQANISPMETDWSCTILKNDTNQGKLLIDNKGDDIEFENSQGNSVRKAAFEFASISQVAEELKPRIEFEGIKTNFSDLSNIGVISTTNATKPYFSSSINDPLKVFEKADVIERTTAGKLQDGDMTNIPDSLEDRPLLQQHLAIKFLDKLAIDIAAIPLDTKSKDEVLNTIDYILNQLEAE